MEEEKDIRQGCELSKSFGSILGDIGLYITYFKAEEQLYLGNY
jgi:hypothetical protein